MKEVFELKDIQVLIKGVNSIMDVPEFSVVKVLYVILIYTISLSPKLGAKL